MSFKCDECGNLFKRKDHLKNHTNRVHLGITFICDICNKKMSSVAQLTKHQKSVHLKVRRKYEECLKQFTLFSYESHLKSLRKSKETSTSKLHQYFAEIAEFEREFNV